MTAILEQLQGLVAAAEIPAGTLGVALILAIASLGITYRRKSKAYGTLALFYAAIALGDLYWLLYLGFYHVTPQYSYISEVAWYAAWLFLLLLLRQMQGERPLGRHPLLWLIPVFTGGMCVFYMRWGDYVGNLISAVFMTLLLWRALPGCFTKESGSSAKRWFSIAVVAFCLVEYIMWTLSCFFDGDTLANPYKALRLLDGSRAGIQIGYRTGTHLPGV